MINNISTTLITLVIIMINNISTTLIILVIILIINNISTTLITLIIIIINNITYRALLPGDPSPWRPHVTSHDFIRFFLIG